jgi:hypothetical protein
MSKRKPTKAKPRPKRRGRPRAEIDLRKVERLAALMATDDEIAAELKVSRSTIARRKETAAFSETLVRGKDRGLLSLRRAQFKAALKGNTTMQIWLGKQLLGQKDVVTNEHKGEILIRQYVGVAIEQV